MILMAARYHDVLKQHLRLFALPRCRAIAGVSPYISMPYMKAQWRSSATAPRLSAYAAREYTASASAASKCKEGSAVEILGPRRCRYYRQQAMLSRQSDISGASGRRRSISEKWAGDEATPCQDDLTRRCRRRKAQRYEPVAVGLILLLPRAGQKEKCGRPAAIWSAA